ncbi:MAG: hypothetical protein WD988_03745 [Candidatus Curtissbacteria bacterium]
MNPNPELEQFELENEAVKQVFDTWDQIIMEKGLIFGPKDEPLEATYLFGSEITNQRYSLYPAEKIFIEKHSSPPIKDPRFKPTDEETWILIEISPENPYSSILGKHTSQIARLGAIDYTEGSSATKTVDYYALALIVGISSKGRSFQSHDWREVETPETASEGKNLYPYIKKQPGQKSAVFLDEEPGHEIETIEPLSDSALERIGTLATKVSEGKVQGDKFQL